MNTLNSNRPLRVFEAFAGIGAQAAALKRMNIDYVDIFYHHRMDPNTPLYETMSGKQSIRPAP